MIALLQRVSEASVTIDGLRMATVGSGMLALIGIKPADDESAAARLLKRLLRYRMFTDNAGRMNLDIAQVNGGLLLVPQFTLAADTRQGLRPGFSTAAAPAYAQPLFQWLVEAAKASHPQVASGVFGATMQVGLINDGPITFWLES